MGTKIRIPIIIEHYPGDEYTRAYVANDSTIQADGLTPEEAVELLKPVIKYFTSDPEINPRIRQEHRDLLENPPEVSIREIEIEL